MITDDQQYQHQRWMDDGVCKTHDPELWWANEGSSEGRRAVDEAVMLCHTCPVRDMCAAYAIENEEWGIWGALTETDRRKLRRRNTA